MVVFAWANMKAAGESVSEMGASMKSAAQQRRGSGEVRDRQGR